MTDVLVLFKYQIFLSKRVLENNHFQRRDNSLQQNIDRVMQLVRMVYTGVRNLKYRRNTHHSGATFSSL